MKESRKKARAKFSQRRYLLHTDTFGTVVLE